MTHILLVFGFLLSAAGIHMIQRGDPLGWTVFGFFGLCSLIIAIPVLPKRWFTGVSQDSFVGGLRGEIQIPNPKHGVLEPTAEGLRHTMPDGEEAFIRWEQVDRIATFKLDLFATDCICLAFEGRFDGSPYQIHEEMIGFNQIFEPLQTAFPSIPDTWYFDVMTPAFETKATTLFERSPLEASNAGTE